MHDFTCTCHPINAFVNKSAYCSTDETWFYSTILCLIFYLNKLKLMLICFDCWWCTGLLTRSLVLLLSTNTGVGPSISNPISDMNPLNQHISWINAYNAMHSAYIEVVTTVVCSLDCQNIGPPAIKFRNPVVDLQLSLFSTLSVSLPTLMHLVLQMPLSQWGCITVAIDLLIKCVSDIIGP